MSRAIPFAAVLLLIAGCGTIERTTADATLVTPYVTQDSGVAKARDFASQELSFGTISPGTWTNWARTGG